MGYEGFQVLLLVASVAFIIYVVSLKRKNKDKE